MTCIYGYLLLWRATMSESELTGKLIRFRHFRDLGFTQMLEYFISLFVTFLTSIIILQRTVMGSFITENAKMDVNKHKVVAEFYVYLSFSILF